MEQRNMKKQRKKYAITSTLLSLVLIITGTFAWSSISQSVLNEVNLLGVIGGRVHDDFNKQTVAVSGDTANKDIYAENFGEEDLIVRIKLLEYLEIGGVAVTGGSRIKTSWVPYKLGNTEAARGYVDWTMGGSKIFLPTFNLDTDTTDPLQPLALATDASGDAIDDVALGLTGTAGSHETKSTLIQYQDVMSIDAWIAKGSPIGRFWVVDDDGWAYWAEKLAPGEATSLLLNKLTFTTIPGGASYYAIDVIGEFATVADIGDFSEVSPKAIDLLGVISAPSIIPTTAGTTFTDPDTNVVWRVLVPNDGNGNALIITEYVYNVGQQYNGTNIWSLYESSALKTGMDAWYATNVGATLTGQALDYAYQDADGNLVGSKGVIAGTGVEYNASGASWDANANMIKARTVAGAIGTKGNGKVFALSVSEANEYFSNNTNRIAKDTLGTAQIWWLRSPGPVSPPVSAVSTVGTVGGATPTLMDRGFRPALWVRLPVN